MANYTLKYRTFQSLVDEVMNDFKKYQDNGQIDPQDMIKVARRCNYELGLRIYKTKETVLDIVRGRTKLPNDFYVLNFALLLGKHVVKQPVIQGTHVENFKVEDGKIKYQPAPGQPDICCDAVVVPCTVHLDCHGDENVLVQTFKSQIYEYKDLYPLTIVSDTEDFNGFCPGKYWQDRYVGTIKNGWLHTSTETGKVYINYQGDMEDDEGNLLVPDHELLNEFYEYALKQRIVENLIMNDEELNAGKIQIIEQRYRAARNNALTLVNTPNFSEMREVANMTRNAWYNRFYSMFR